MSSTTVTPTSPLPPSRASNDCNLTPEQSQRFDEVMACISHIKHMLTDFKEDFESELNSSTSPTTTSNHSNKKQSLLFSEVEQAAGLMGPRTTDQLMTAYESTTESITERFDRIIATVDRLAIRVDMCLASEQRGAIQLELEAIRKDALKSKENMLQLAKEEMARSLKKVVGVNNG
ncbi:uncharacterized protein VTP21DRAFT_11738 [Calcarisporiella thermophila]|uniref:uncharacterized protein n=1 Tax=Calcarisporiella thermophila TaxID=911321 RepID=UPI003743CB57